MNNSEPQSILVTDLGRLAYGEALEVQRMEHEHILSGRDDPSSPVAHLLVVEHDPVLTISKRSTSRQNIRVSPERLKELGISIHETDRGGDITYHGPGQLVVYPIVDLNRAGLNLHAYMRLLEDAVIGACERFGLEAGREEGATGVWVPSRLHSGQPAKVCAMGVRVRRWVTMHGLALNVDPDMSHFQTIVPCGLVGRPVTSLREQLGDRCPTFADAAEAVCAQLADMLKQKLTQSVPQTDHDGSTRS